MSRVYSITALLIISIAFGAGGCSSGSGDGLLAPETNSAPAEFDPGLELKVLEQTYIDGGNPGIVSHTVSEADGVLEVTVGVENAANLKAFFIELDYNSEALSPIDCTVNMPLDTQVDPLTASWLGTPGTASHGQVITQYIDKPGFSGSAILATLRFNTAVNGKLPKYVSATRIAPPAPQVEWTAETNTLAWYYDNPGDYDQDRQVTVADIVPLAIYFGRTGDFPRADITSVIDGNGDGEINFVDIQTIVSHFRNGMWKYWIYFASQQNLTPAEEDFQAVIEPIAEGEFADAIGNPRKDRLRFEHKIAQPALNGWLWVGSLAYGGEPSMPVAVGRSIQPFNSLPFAMLDADPRIGAPGLEVSFSGNHSNDIGGEIVKYQIDPDGFDDGWDWVDLEAGGVYNHTFSDEGSYLATLLVTDDQGATAISQVVVNVFDEPHQIPTVILTTEEPVVNEQTEVWFETEVSTDPNGEFVASEWDYEGNGIFVTKEDKSGAGEYLRENIYDPGFYRPTVRVWDDKGASALGRISLIVLDDKPPVAEISADKLTGVAPFTVTLSGEGSYDPEGDLYGASWKLPNHSEGGTVVNQVIEPHEVMFFFAGTYVCELEVRDSIGQRSTASITIEVEGLSQTESIAVYNAEWVQASKMAMVSGKPAILAIISNSVDPGYGLYYARAKDEFGTNWNLPTRLPALEGIVLSFCDLIEVDGYPAVCWTDGINRVKYSRALDPDGTTWGDVYIIPNPLVGNSSPPDLELIHGLPTIAFSDGSRMYYCEAEDALGESWQEAVFITRAERLPSISISLAEVGDSFGIVYTDDWHMSYAYLDTAGETPEFSTFEFPSGSRDFNVKLGVIAGYPTIVAGSSIIRADDVLGLSWPETSHSTGTYVGWRSRPFPNIGKHQGYTVAFTGNTISFGKGWLAAEWFPPWYLDRVNDTLVSDDLLGYSWYDSRLKAIHFVRIHE